MTEINYFLSRYINPYLLSLSSDQTRKNFFPKALRTLEPFNLKYSYIWNFWQDTKHKQKHFQYIAVLVLLFFTVLRLTFS